MKERPILFNGPMVRAILEGRKTQTRRIAIKTSRPENVYPTDFDAAEAKIEIENKQAGARYWKQCPYGQPGDRLWVRETFDPIYGQSPPDRVIEIDYRADHSRTNRWRIKDEFGTRRWKPSIHMPRWASRILLEITDVRVERLQEISEADAIAEGVQRGRDGMFNGGPHKIKGTPRAFHTAVGAYDDLWGHINGPTSWQSNPWVWVIEFRRVEGGAA